MIETHEPHNLEETTPAKPAGLRYRIRFRKEGDARWISHLDLVRTCERLFRRAGLRLRMSEGFHPKPRMIFPSALAVGVAGNDEILELDLEESPTADELLARLSAATAPGLVFTSVESRPWGSPKVRVVAVTYELPIPASRQADVAARCAALLAETTHVVERPDKDSSVDVRQGLLTLEISAGTLRIRLRVGNDGSVRPREVLTALGVDDLESDGACLTRVRVEVADESSAPIAAFPNPTE